MRVARATGQAPATLWQAPYRRTLYENYHLDQLDYVESLRGRFDALHLATLMNFAFANAQGLRDEGQKLLAEANLLPTPEQSRVATESLLREMAARGWLTVQ